MFWRVVFRVGKGRHRTIKNRETFGFTMSLRPCQKLWAVLKTTWRIAIDRRQTLQVKARRCLVSIMFCPRVLVSSILHQCVVFFQLFRLWMVFLRKVNLISAGRYVWWFFLVPYSMAVSHVKISSRSFAAGMCSQQIHVRPQSTTDPSKYTKAEIRGTTEEMHGDQQRVSCHDGCEAVWLPSTDPCDFPVYGIFLGHWGIPTRHRFQYQTDLVI